MTEDEDEDEDEDEETPLMDEELQEARE